MLRQDGRQALAALYRRNPNLRRSGKVWVGENSMKRATLGCLLALLGPEFARAQIKLPPTPVHEVTEEF